MRTVHIISALLALTLLWSCSDTDTAPASLLSGSMVYQGQTVPMDGAPDVQSPLALLNWGKQDSGPGLFVDGAGNFYQKMLPGRYQLTRTDGTFPFEMPDFEYIGDDYGYNRFEINLEKGNVVQDVMVIPYYLLDNVYVWYDKGMDAIKCMVTIHRNTDPDLKESAPDAKAIHLFSSPTILVNSGTPCRKAVVLEETLEGSINLSMPLSEFRKAYPARTTDKIYCRLAIELDGIPEHFLFSQTVIINTLKQ